ncbi:hypothetical protein E2C01_032080 [Portunus trituberculatus]|uniref:Uncharacterized protein n=1 Tax=Portunus trituberculatus TaxID=210409 RepID=A0A5B7EWJ5_PORTR|nr:hypothetical protein [Portunus trituberculatus]
MLFLPWLTWHPSRQQRRSHPPSPGSQLPGRAEAATLALLQEARPTYLSHFGQGMGLDVAPRRGYVFGVAAIRMHASGDTNIDRVTREARGAWLRQPPPQGCCCCRYQVPAAGGTGTGSVRTWVESWRLQFVLASSCR